ncbi:MAG TPA: VOC family protein [Casimicrobiaceae bacterium]|jgi:predicted enzyme related to lactoylglutathione lyase|nr:VOC family protein [Casimicrobiaceae bacterium]
MPKQDALSWFEIPAADLRRATRFYEAVLGRSLKTETMGDRTLAVFPYHEPGVGGCVIAGNGHVPSPNGAVVYLDAAPKIDDALARVAAAGGRVVLDKTALPGDLGFFAHVIDSEGNRVGLHALG